MCASLTLRVIPIVGVSFVCAKELSLSNTVFMPKTCFIIYRLVGKGAKLCKAPSNLTQTTEIDYDDKFSHRPRRLHGG